MKTVVLFFLAFCIPVAICVTCGSNFEGNTGVIKTPNYPANYPDNADCTWRIATSGSKIKFVFNGFNIEADSRCGYDYIQLYKVLPSGASSVGKYCGGQSPGTQIIDSGDALIKFVSDGSVNEKGFSLTYTAVVNGGWSDWDASTPEGTCSRTCGMGVQTHASNRQCNNPPPSGGGARCSGDSVLRTIGDCKIRECPVEGNWSSWGDYEPSHCSVSCGNGTQLETRFRSCTNPTPSFGGSNCTGPNSETREAICIQDPCPIDGGWSWWGDYVPGTCSVSCGNGTMIETRNRTCTDPAPRYGGSNCNGTDEDTREEICMRDPCPIDGGWSWWGDYVPGTCSVSCGNGTMIETRNRTCTDPAPRYGGSNCNGTDEDTRERMCIKGSCPINGSWRSWGNWTRRGDCSVTCGDGILSEIRYRSCDDPEPRFGGQGCKGPSEEGRSVQCSEDQCQGVCFVDGTNLPNIQDFTKYYQCQNNEKVLKSCPHGKRWDQSSLECTKVCNGFQSALISHPYDCYKYVQCFWGMHFVMNCPKGTAWSNSLQICDDVNRVNCRY